MKIQKNILFSLIAWAITITQLSAQKTDKFIIAEDVQTHHSALFVSQCQTPELCVIVFSSTIDGITFIIHNDSSLLKNIVHDYENNQYIICLQPIKKKKYYLIKVSCQGFSDKFFRVSAISATVVKWFIINSENQSLINKLSKSNHTNNSLKQEIKYEKFQNKQLVKKYNYLSLGYGSGVTEYWTGEWTLDWRSKGSVGWGIHTGFSPIDKTTGNFTTKYIDYSVGIKCYPLQNYSKDELFKPLSLKDLYVMINYGTISLMGNGIMKGISLLTGFDWMIPCFKDPDGGVIINFGGGVAFGHKVSGVYEAGIGLYLNL